MTKLDRFLVYAEGHRLPLCVAAVVMVAAIAWVDWLLPTVSIGYLYLVPVLLSAAALNGVQIVIMAVLCGFLREAFDPLEWAPGATGRIVVGTACFAMTGFFVAELNQRRRLLTEHLAEREEQMRMRRHAEMQVRVLIETTPLAILMLDDSGRVELANESARQLLGFEDGELSGEQVQAYLPILYRILKTHRAGSNLRTNVECKGVRRTGEVFLAHVWLSTYSIAGGQGLAAVVWDSSENLRDREGAGVDSMMATSRVLIGAISHEIRNLASAATAAHAMLGEQAPLAENEQYRVLGTLIQGLEKIATSGLHASSGRETGTADLGTVLDEARVVIEPSLREAGISVTWDVSENLPLVQADHHSLLQVFVNLARNCRQALEDAALREVRICTAVESDLVQVRFCDSGPGVAHPEELFRPFQSGAHSVGLGLYISRAILRSHGGGLRYEPQASGSCFTVELWPVENAVEV
ncbi:MAG TPA: ATP-binding protein [Candidatus Acidoferrales bacterium]|nr:ATP-binding protein [Candidatus Acidoferrales bacterium]